MPKNQRALTRAVRDRMADTGETYTEAKTAIEDPANQILCEDCGWTVGMICPECPGCGCYDGRCSGWRHAEYMDEDTARELAECPECGGDGRSPYGCTCYEDEAV